MPDRDWLETLVRERSACSRLSGRSFFSVKIQAHQLGKFSTFLRRDFAPMARRGLWQPFRSHPPAILLLFRRELARSVASFHFSLCTGCFDQGRIFSFQLRPLQALGDRSALLDDLAAYRVHLEWLVDALSSSAFPVHCLAFEDLMKNQNHVLETVLRRIDPVDTPTPAKGSIKESARAELLDVRIAQEDSAWQQERKQWLNHLCDRLKAERLLDHPVATDCRRLIDRLDSHCISLHP